MKRLCVLLSVISLAHVATAPLVTAQLAPPPLGKPSASSDATTGEAATPEDPNDPARDEKLAAYLTGAKFVGKFTVDGKEDAGPKTEEYTISKCEKLPAENMFRFTARIKYGDVDNEVPMDLKVLWSGRTPVITLDSFWIPGMGTFGARVLIHSDRYAGTWQHDAVGGHLFGKIEAAKK